MTTNSTSPNRRRESRSSRPTARRIVIAGSVSIVVLGACSGDGVPTDITRPEQPLVTAPAGSNPGTDPAPSPTEAPAPEPTAAPEPAPEPTAAPEAGPPATTEPTDTGDGTTTEEAVVVVLLILLVVGVIVGLIAWVSGRSRSRRRSEESVRSELASISSRARWVIDQGVPVMIGTLDPLQLESAWTSANTTLLDLQRELNSVAGALSGDGSRALSELGTAIASMRSSLDSGYRMRVQHADQPDLVSATDRAILVFEAATA